MSVTLKKGGSPVELKKKVGTHPNAVCPVLTRTARAKAEKAFPDKKFKLVSGYALLVRCQRMVGHLRYIPRFETRMSSTLGSALASGLSQLSDGLMRLLIWPVCSLPAFLRLDGILCKYSGVDV